jgi:NADPH:quinone reductase-like Zn-dependent oxidoreductase
MKKMKAVVCTKYGPPEVLEIREVEKPVPKDNEVLVKVHATTVTVADFRIRSFTVPPSFWIPARLALGLTKPKKPILGVELAGEIEAIGKDVKQFKKGDQIFADTLTDFGGYAEYKCLAENGPIALKPANATYEEAAAIPIGARTALHFLKIAGIKKGQKVLVYGASGSVGTYAVQLAKYFGAMVSGVCSRANFDLVKSLGADKLIDYTERDFIKQLETYDMIFIAVDKCAFSICNRHLSKEGVYINVTGPLKTLPMLWTSMKSKKKLVVGGYRQKRLMI